MVILTIDDQVLLQGTSTASVHAHVGRTQAVLSDGKMSAKALYHGMNREEARILHGLYYHREIVGEELPFTAGELNWLASTPIPRGKDWLGEDGKLKSLASEADDYLASIGATSAAAARPLAYLQACGYITYKKDGNYLRITVTGTGADVARELNTFWGRANILYKRHKDGILWFLATVLVSLITTLVAQCKS